MWVDGSWAWISDGSDLLDADSCIDAAVVVGCVLPVEVDTIACCIGFNDVTHWISGGWLLFWDWFLIAINANIGSLPLWNGCFPTVEFSGLAIDTLVVVTEWNFVLWFEESDVVIEHVSSEFVVTSRIENWISWICGSFEFFFVYVVGEWWEDSVTSISIWVLSCQVDELVTSCVEVADDVWNVHIGTVNIWVEPVVVSLLQCWEYTSWSTEWNYVDTEAVYTQAVAVIDAEVNIGVNFGVVVSSTIFVEVELAVINTLVSCSIDLITVDLADGGGLEIDIDTILVTCP